MSIYIGDSFLSSILVQPHEIFSALIDCDSIREIPTLHRHLPRMMAVEATKKVGPRMKGSFRGERRARKRPDRQVRAGDNRKQVTRTDGQGPPTPIHARHPTQPSFRHRKTGKKLLKSKFSHFSTRAHGPMDGRTDGRKKPLIESATKKVGRPTDEVSLY